MAALGRAPRRLAAREAAIPLDALDWRGVERDLDADGAAVAPKLITRETCRELSALYPATRALPLARRDGEHGFGRGEYKYFAYPLPEPIAALRRGLYARLAPIADRWNEAMGDLRPLSRRARGVSRRCHAAGQTRPTPLLLRYGPGDYNCLHQDVYGEHLFPLQLAILLSEPGRDFTGGEFVLTEQRPRMQSRAEVVSSRPGRRGDLRRARAAGSGDARRYRVNLRHGVSRDQVRRTLHPRHHLPRRGVTLGAARTALGPPRPLRGGRERLYPAVPRAYRLGTLGDGRLAQR